MRRGVRGEARTAARSPREMSVRSGVVGMVLALILASVGQVSMPVPAIAQVAEGVDLSSPLSLDELVRIAKERNFGLQRFRETSAQARSSRRSTLSGLLPSLAGSIDYNQSESRFRGPSVDLVTGEVRTANLRSPSDSYQLGVGGRLNIVDPVQWYGLAESNRRIVAADYSVEDAEQDLVFFVQSQYYALIRAQALAAVRQRSRDLSGEQLERARALYELGSVARTDVLQAQVSHASAERERIAAANAIEQERANLAVLLSISLDSPLEVEQPGALPDTSLVFDEAAYVAEGLEQRPDYLRARSALEAARLSETAAGWRRWPSIGGNYSYGKREDKIGDLFDDFGNEYSWSFGVGLDVPIFDGFSTKAAIEQAAASRRQEERTMEELRLQVALDVRQALLDLTNAVEGIRAAREGVGFAEESVRLQQALYESGGGTLLEWNNAQVELTRARNDLVETEINLRQAHAALEKARGRAN